MASDVILIIDLVPFVITNSQRAVSEGSSTTVSLNRLEQLNGQFALLKKTNIDAPLSLTTSYYSIFKKNLTVTLTLTSDDDFFNKYNILKSAVDGLIALTEFNPFNRFLNFVSYWGHKDYLEYGQFTNVSFSNTSDTNLFQATLTMESFTPNFSDPRSFVLTTAPTGA